MFKVKSPFLFLLISILLVIVPTPREMDAESNDNIELQESASTDSIECNKQEGTEDDDLKDEEENEKKCPEKANSYETMKDDTASSIKQESSEQNTEEPGEFEEPIQSEDKNQEVDMSTLFWTYFYRTIYINSYEFVCNSKIIYLLQSRVNKLAIAR
ncbi:MAG TPA: hypothetical protein GX705_08320, partial [Clostridiales bacterium]|nr:hypothetical protein [Clostridiales bacterium]